MFGTDLRAGGWGQFKFNVREKQWEVCMFGRTSAAHRDQVFKLQSVMQNRYIPEQLLDQKFSPHSIFFIEHIWHFVRTMPSVLATAELWSRHKRRQWKIFHNYALKNGLKQGFAHIRLAATLMWFKVLAMMTGTSYQEWGICLSWLFKSSVLMLKHL